MKTIAHEKTTRRLHEVRRELNRLMENSLPLSRVRELLAEQREACRKNVDGLSMFHHHAQHSADREYWIGVCNAERAVRDTPLVAIDTAKETT